MSWFKFCLPAGAGGLVLLFGGSAMADTSFATVISYNPGNYTGPYNVPLAGSNGPQGYTGVEGGYPGITTPFNPEWDTSQIVQIGGGGSIELQFATPVIPTANPDIGVFTNCGLDDVNIANFPNAMTGRPAGNISTNAADVLVSSDGKTWTDLLTHTFDVPTNYFTNPGVGPYDITAPANPTVADFGKPFTAPGSIDPLSLFSNEDYAQVVSTLNGSGGGTWLSLGSSGLSSVDYVEFEVPLADTPDDQIPLILDAVSVSELNPSQVPEPAAGLGFVVALSAGALRRPRRVRAGE
jgi:hypothetical protein